MKNLKINNRVILTLILILGFGLRIFRLTAKSIWFDEACSISFASNNFNILTHRYLMRPTYFLVLKGWVAIFGSHEFAVRFLSVIFGVLSIWMIYKLGEILFSQKLGLISAFILAISSYHINYSQQVRNYTLFGFLGLGSMIFFVKSLKEKKSIFFWCYLLMSIFLLGTHFYGIFIVLAQNIYLFILFFIEKKTFFNRKNIIYFSSQLLIIILFFATVFILKSNISKDFSTFNYLSIHKADLSVVVETFEAFASGGTFNKQRGVGRDLNYEMLIVPRFFSIVFIPLFFIGAFFFKRKKGEVIHCLDNKQITLLLLIWLGLPIFLSYLFSAIFFNIYVVRYFFAVMPAFYILSARGIILLKKRISRILAFSLLIILSIISLNILYGVHGKGDWRQLTEYVQKNIQEGENIIFLPLKEIVPFWYYYKYNSELPLKNIDRYGKNINAKWCSDFTDGSHRILGIPFNDDADSILKTIKETIDKEKNILLIISPSTIGSEKAQFIKNDLTMSYKLKRKHCFPEVEAEVLEYSLF